VLASETLEWKEKLLGLIGVQRQVIIIDAQEEAREEVLAEKNAVDIERATVCGNERESTHATRGDGTKKTRATRSPGHPVSESHVKPGIPA